VFCWTSSSQPCSSCLQRRFSRLPSACSTSTVTLAVRSSTERWWQRHPLAERVLVLLAPGRLYHDPAGHGHYLRVLPVFARKAALWLQGLRLRDPWHRWLGCQRLGSPHVHHGPVLKPFLRLHDLHDRIPTASRSSTGGDALRALSLSSAMLFALASQHVPDRVSTYVSAGTGGTLPSTIPIRVAHLHYVLFGALSSPSRRPCYFWFPKNLRRRLNDKLGDPLLPDVRRFNLTFFPMHLLV